jgi:O-antigen/teichoic acid export membrane protein
MTDDAPATDAPAAPGDTAIGRSIVWNLLGQGIPMGVALLAIPLLVHRLGPDRFGLLTLAWVVIGYFSLFDLGIGRSLTKVVAEKRGSGRQGEIPAMIWTALLLTLLLGLAGSLTLWVLSPWLLHDALNIPGALQHEALRSFYALALSLPVVISGAGLRGVLEGYQRFGLANAVRVCMGAFTFLGPLMVLPFSRNLTDIVAVLIAGQVLTWIAYLSACVHVVPDLLRGPVIASAAAKSLARFAGWLTVTNIVGPMMVYFDRFLVGALISLSAVTYYATPYEIITRIGFIPAAFAGVLFPAFAASSIHQREQAARLMGRGITYVFLGLFPLALIAVMLAREGLSLWLGPTFATASTGVLQWLAAGVFINGLAQIPYALVQGFNRPDITAKLHLLELPFYLVLAWQLIVHEGIEGAAAAWTLRAAVDATLLLAVTAWLLPEARLMIRNLCLALPVALITFVLGTQLPGLPLRLSFFTGATLLLAVIARRLGILSRVRFSTHAP